MPSLEVYRKMLGGVNTVGQAHKRASDLVMEATWDSDIDSRIAWFYDQEHDDQFNIAYDIHPEKSGIKIPVEVKFSEMEYNSLSKDETAYHIMFKPSYIPNVPYYAEKFESPYGAVFPVGLYCDIADAKGVYHRWLVVGQYRHYSNQFPTYFVLPCDHKLQWIYNRKQYESWGVLRSQSSYNNGIWESYKFVNPENQKIIWLPMNDQTKTIFYNQRIVISAQRDIPVVWECSKVEDMNVRGIARYTFKQIKWDEHKDYIEKDECGNIIGMWADYYSPTQPDPKTLAEAVSSANIYSQISYSGTKPSITVGGSYKKFTVTFYNNDEQITHKSGYWRYTVDGKDVGDLLTFDTTGLEQNQVKFKFAKDLSYVGKKLIVNYTTNDNKLHTKTEMSLVAL